MLLSLISRHAEKENGSGRSSFSLVVLVVVADPSLSFFVDKSTSSVVVDVD